MTLTDAAAHAASGAIKPMSKPMDQLCVNTIRTLSMDAVQAANSGHPGTPMALAPVAYCLWQRFLRFDPDHPIWPNRDRFVLSAGHASMLLYAMLHLTGVKAVNPKYETLGRAVGDAGRHQALPPARQQMPRPSGISLDVGRRDDHRPARPGRGDSVGMAIAARWLARYFNRPGFELFDYNVYALCGDGCMMEGISGEAASLAGHLKLSNLCWIYDNNHITIEGNTALAFSEDVATRFIGYGWNVTRVGDANDLEMLERAFETFKSTSDRPTLIIVDSHIAYGAPNKQDTSAAHGEPLGEEEIRLTKRNYGWPRGRQVPRPRRRARALRRRASARAAQALHAAWWTQFAAYQTRSIPSSPTRSIACCAASCPTAGTRTCRVFPADAKGMASRDASGKVLNAIAKNVPWLIGGSADLAPSTKTRLTFDGAGDFSAEQSGRPQLPLRHPRARHGRRSSTACRCRSSGRSARAS